ncbi:L-alanine dehydrogenase [Candidatus Thermokryptus mobilis]|uniref:Alanine dehydrogenase n=1 Tax=Candidatus Thermokryptus mobilis TaxID=1643428 RepID=A0A0S4NEA9_9BACT|nr:alanine dehydrogenase [Candidatus Thermokryptus mobilis]CUU09243.1 L-alanine dehydrogenase [Candidatus Thermokryptus mobilis]
MNIGIPRESVDAQKILERRVALTPAGVKALVDSGHEVFVESMAGEYSGFSDAEYEKMGGKIVFSKEEVYKRAQMIVKVSRPSEAEYSYLCDGHLLFGFLHLAVAPKSFVEILLERKITAIGYEIIELPDGRLPILQAMSEIAGQMAIVIAARYLQNEDGGRGIVLGGIPGVPPATVVILGAGVVGQNAIRAALGLGAHVVVLDKDVDKLREVEKLFDKRVETAIANVYNIEKAVQFADVLIGAVLIHGALTPKLVTEEMVKKMKPGSVIIDVSIDQGGCIETSRPTTIVNPVFVKHGVIHYCVPNIASNVARTATYALTNVSLPYILEIANSGLEHVLRERPSFAKGVYTYLGYCTNQSIAEIFNLKYKKIEELL